MRLSEKISEVKKYLTENEDKYLLLESQVRQACSDAVNQLSRQVVRRVYGRDEKQSRIVGGKSLFKSPEKIALKWMRDYPNAETPAILPDIIGLTVVVYYPDQIVLVHNCIRKLLKECSRIESEEPVQKKASGYYATHVIFKSKHADHRGLQCELQIKTMLHEAWSAKTHDLIYKPLGRHDRRLDRMMDHFADALQAIEIQSETLRDLIFEDWYAERNWRLSLRKAMFSALPNSLELASSSDPAGKICQEIREKADLIRTADYHNSLVQDLLERIDSVCKTSIQQGYLLHSYLAVVREREEEAIQALEMVDQWLKYAPKLLSEKKIKPHELWATPLVVHAVGDLNNAIEVSEQLYSDETICFDEGSRQIIALNLANQLVEKAYFSLPVFPSDRVGQDKWLAEANGIKLRISQLIVQAEPLRKADPSVFEDLEGMVDVVLSADSKTIRKGIDKIYQGCNPANPLEKEFANAFFEVNIRVAWRRLFEVEAKQITLPQSGVRLA